MPYAEADGRPASPAIYATCLTSRRAVPLASRLPE